MSTRATLSVFDKKDKFDIYRHHDGYPEGVHGIVCRVKAAMARAWTMPRFEAGDFAAAIVANMKSQPGSVYLTRDADLHMDRQYHYDITCAAKAIQITVHTYSEAVGNIVPTFKGTIDEAVKHFDAHPITNISKLDDPWTALAMAEMALADIEAARWKGYLEQARFLVFAAMDAKRAESLNDS